jgi:phospholipid/cholesterol/gamma-HCH transport system substrate-binding protein
LVCLAIFAVVARRTFLRHEADVTTLIDDSAGIGPSSPVLLNGIDVGHVVRVGLSGSPDPNKTVRITMRFPRGILNEIPADSTAAITAGNLLGDKYINISRGGNTRHVEPGGELMSSPTQDIGTALSRANGPLNQVNTILGHVDKILGYVDSQQGTLGKFLNNPSLQQHLTATANSEAELMKDVGRGRGVFFHVDDISAEARKPLARLQTIQADLQHGQGSLGRFLHDPAAPTLNSEAQSTIAEANDLISAFNNGNRTTVLMDHIRQASDKLDAAMARINSGQGTIGQFILNPQLRDSLHRVQQELNRLTSDFGKHPARFVQLRVALF